MEKPACRNCQFYSDPEAERAKCRVNPPVALLEFGRDQGKGIWPTVIGKDHWCRSWSQAVGTKIEGGEPEPFSINE